MARIFSKTNAHAKDCARHAIFSDPLISAANQNIVMLRVARGIRFLIVMIAYAAHMVWKGRSLDYRERMRFVAQRQKAGSAALIKGIRISAEVIGEIPLGKPLLLVSNHIGTLDPWILASQFEVAFVAKSEMGNWPVIGWVCDAVGIIFAHRKNVMKTQQTVDEIRARMRSEVAVMIFPEGTTSNGESLLPFKTGGFEAVSHMEDGWIVPIYFHVRGIKGDVVTEEGRKIVTWSSPQTMLSNLWKMLGLGKMHYVIRVGTPIASNQRNRKELAACAQQAVQVLKEAEENDLKNSQSLETKIVNLGTEANQVARL